MNLSRSAFRRRAFVATAIAALLAAGCSSDSAKPASTAVDASAAANVAGGASSTVAASPETTAAETDAAGTTPEPTPATEPAETAPADTAAADTTLPPGATPGLDDYDQDGEPDPTCGTQDFGAGLVLRIPCEISTAHEPAEGTTLVDQSLFRRPVTTPRGSPASPPTCSKRATSTGARSTSSSSTPTACLPRTAPRSPARRR